MYAIIKSGSRQYRVEPEAVIEVNRLALDEGADFETDQVLMFGPDSGDAAIGAPFVEGAVVRGKVLAHRRGKKVVVFKQKRRKNYKRTRGHRQELTVLQISAIETGGKKATAKPAAPKATGEAPAAEDKPAAQASETKKPAAKASEDKPKAAAKKPAAKKPAAKADDSGAGEE